MNYHAVIYSHSISPRLSYIVDFLSGYYKAIFRLTSDEDSYRKSECSCKINYSYHHLADDEIWIHPHALLFESSVHPVKVDCLEYKSQKIFFKTEGTWAFDLFAAIFYLISRYEEYLPHKKDSYGRYDHTNSIAFREGFLHLPVVNIWLEDFRNILLEKNGYFKEPSNSFSFLPTYDIDMAWSFKNKGFERNTGALLMLLLTGKWRSFSHRVKVLKNKIQDPYDAYEWLDELHENYGLSPVYFFLVATHRGKYDKNISVRNKAFRELVHYLSGTYKIALHPSWASGDHPVLLQKEKAFLENIIRKPVDASRQHYIRFDLPDTYRHLLNAGIKNDYSMGYGTINGFRSSIASGFYWYDLKQDEATSLYIHPFCFMDANAYYEQQLNPQQTLQELLELYKAVKDVNGKLITIWHNSFLGNSKEFQGWKEVYNEFVASIH